MGATSDYDTEHARTGSYGLAAPAEANLDTLHGQCASDCLLADPEPQSDLHQALPSGIQLDRFGEVGLIETAPADRDRAADQMCSSRAAVHAEVRGQLHERRAVAVPRHQLVDLLGPKKGLSHPK